MKKVALSLMFLIPAALSACSTATSPTQTGTNLSQSAGSVDLQATLQQFSALSAAQQLELARSMGSLDLLDWATANQSATAEARATAASTLLTQKPALAAEIAAQIQRSAGGMGGPGGGMPPGGAGGPGGMGDLPPNIEAIKNTYPELAAALEAMQSLTPEERRTQMDALFTAHPEWREIVMPAGGMGGPGGTPPSGAPPMGAPQASASPQS
jgi:hypothetical protein